MIGLNIDPTFEKLLNKSKIIPAVRHPEDLPEVLKIPQLPIVILLGGDINDLVDIIEIRHKYPSKTLLAHIDLIHGIGKDTAGMRYLKRLGFDGIVSVKWQLLRCAKENDMLTVQRIFFVDSEAIRTSLKIIKQVSPDAIEIMPATVPKFAIDELYNATDLCVLGGGLLRTEADVYKALDNGFKAITSSRRNLWNLKLNQK